MTELMSQKAYAEYKGFSRQYVNELVRDKVLRLKRGKIDRDEADKTLEARREPARPLRRKVREDHAARAGKTFSWTNPPEGGHPGEDYNCRCWAEPVAQTATGLQQEIISSINDAGNKWTWVDFVQHFYKGRGKAVSLSQIGLFSDVVEHAESIIFKRVESQIERLAQSVVDGQLQDTFARPYYFGSVSFSLGDSTVRGNIKGSVRKYGKILLVESSVEYLFFDEFTDPINIRENRKNGTSSSDKADPKTELFGTAYDIVGRWLTKVTGTVKAP